VKTGASNAAFVAANIGHGGTGGSRPLQIEAVRLGARAAATASEANGLPKLNGLMTEFIANQGKVWLCGACAKPRHHPDQLADA